MGPMGPRRPWARAHGPLANNQPTSKQPALGQGQEGLYKMGGGAPWRDSQFPQTGEILSFVYQSYTGGHPPILYRGGYGGPCGRYAEATRFAPGMWNAGGRYAEAQVLSF